MSYGDPVRLLAKLVGDGPPPRGTSGHTLQDEFAHFCSVHGLTVENAGENAVSWARFIYFYDRLVWAAPSTDADPT